MGYSERRAFGDSFLPVVKQILAVHFRCSVDDVRTAPDYDDTKLATDLFVKGQRIALRIRTKEYRRYLGQFTVRTSGDVPELRKLQECGVNYYFYGHEAMDGSLGEWFIMHVAPPMFAFPVEDQTNGTDSKFRAFRINRDAVVGCGIGGPKNQNEPSNN